MRYRCAAELVVEELPEQGSCRTRLLAGRQAVAPARMHRGSKNLEKCSLNFDSYTCGLRQVGGRYWSLAQAEHRVRWAACLPAACSSEDVRTLLAAAVHLDLAASAVDSEAAGSAATLVAVDVPDRACQDSAHRPFQGAELVVM